MDTRRFGGARAWREEGLMVIAPQVSVTEPKAPEELCTLLRRIFVHCSGSLRCRIFARYDVGLALALGFGHVTTNGMH